MSAEEILELIENHISFELEMNDVLEILISDPSWFKGAINDANRQALLEILED